MGTSVLAPGDRARVRHHLGYPAGIEPVGSIQLGVPATSQPLFLVESAMDRILPEAAQIIMRDLAVLDAIENQMVDALRRLKAQQLGELKIRNSNEERVEQDLLEGEYRRWAKRLSDDLAAPLNPYS